jgi:hypothetical protein
MSDRMKFAMGLATSALEGTKDVPCRQEHFRVGPSADSLNAPAKSADAEVLHLCAIW